MSFRIPANPIKYPLHWFRSKLVQPFFWSLFFLSPILHIFQLDVIHQQMVALNHRYPFSPATLMWVPLSFFACVLLIAFVSTLWGRLFCGWVCPHNTMVEWTMSVRRLVGLEKKSYQTKKREEKWPWMRGVHIGLSIIFAIVLTYFISTFLLLYFVPISWFTQHILSGTLPDIVWWGQGLLMFIGLFMVFAGHEFCRSACPYGLSQSLSAYLSAKWIPMEIRYRLGKETTECKSCRACQTACPVDIDPRKPENLFVGIGEGCFNCGACIDACNFVREPKKKSGLLYFQPFTVGASQRATQARDVAE